MQEITTEYLNQFVISNYPTLTGYEEMYETLILKNYRHLRCSTSSFSTCLLVALKHTQVRLLESLLTALH